MLYEGIWNMHRLQQSPEATAARPCVDRDLAADCEFDCCCAPCCAPPRSPAHNRVPASHNDQRTVIYVTCCVSVWCHLGPHRHADLTEAAVRQLLSSHSRSSFGVFLIAKLLQLFPRAPGAPLDHAARVRLDKSSCLEPSHHRSRGLRRCIC